MTKEISGQRSHCFTFLGALEYLYSLIQQVAVCLVCKSPLNTRKKDNKDGKFNSMPNNNDISD